jgi:hypothetical protein
VTTFDDARAMVTHTTGLATHGYGWENDDVYVVAVDYGDDIPFDAPDYLVDKQTGELRVMYGLLGHEPAEDLRVIGTPPE